MDDSWKKVEESADMIRDNIPGFSPDIGIILGTGLGALGKEIKEEKKIPYRDIPHFPLSTVETHSGVLICGELEGKKVVAMSGRFHRYEGYSMKQIVFPVRVMHKLGIKYLLISNAAGGINPKYHAGDLALIDDIINFTGDNPLIGPNNDRVGPRYPDMYEPTSKELMKKAFKAAENLNVRAHMGGVYVGVTGPNLETRAEYRMMGQFADMVGMSTVPEIIEGVHCGLKILGISVITDECAPETLKPVNIENIIKTAVKAEPKLTAVMKAVVKDISV